MHWLSIGCNYPAITEAILSDDDFLKALEKRYRAVSPEYFANLAAANYQSCLKILSLPIGKRLTGINLHELVAKYGDRVLTLILDDAQLTNKFHAAIIIDQITSAKNVLINNQKSAFNPALEDDNKFYQLGLKLKSVACFKQAISECRHIKSFAELLKIGSLQDLRLGYEMCDNIDLVHMKELYRALLLEITREDQYKTPEILAEEQRLRAEEERLKELAEQKNASLITQINMNSRISHNTQLIYKALLKTTSAKALRSNFFAIYRTYEEVLAHSREFPHGRTALCLELAEQIEIVKIIGQVGKKSTPPIKLSLRTQKILSENNSLRRILMEKFPIFYLALQFQELIPVTMHNVFYKRQAENTEQFESKNEEAAIEMKPLQPRQNN